MRELVEPHRTTGGRHQRFRHLQHEKAGDAREHTVFLGVQRAVEHREEVFAGGVRGRESWRHAQRVEIGLGERAGDDAVLLPQQLAHLAAVLADDLDREQRRTALPVFG